MKLSGTTNPVAKILRAFLNTQVILSICSLWFVGVLGTVTSVSAAVDPDVLMNILSQIAGTGVTSLTGTTTVPVSKDADHLVVFVSPTGKVGVPMDIIVKAVTKDGSIASNYKGTIFMSVENDYKAIIPYPDGYSFTSADQGTKTFSKWLSFSKAGTFKISVSDFAQAKITGSTSTTISETKTTPVVTPTVIKPTPTDTITKPVSVGPVSFKIQKVEIGDKKATITFKVINDTEDIQKFKFIYADSEGNSKSVITSPKAQIRKASGDYTWYIPNLELTKYTISIAWVDKNGESMDSVVSPPFEADLSLSSAGKCVIPNVSGLRVLEKKDTSVLYWDSIPEAVSYKVYKKNASGEYVFLSETKADSYTVHVADGSVKYEEFSVKAMCSDGTESLKFAPSTSVRTGPREIAALVLVSAFIGWFVVRRQRKQLW